MLNDDPSPCDICLNRHECKLLHLSEQIKSVKCPLMLHVIERNCTYSETHSSLIVPEPPGEWRRRLIDFISDHVQ